MKTLTKIDPGILMSKPLVALSQHESCGTRIITTIDPVLPRLAPTSPTEHTIFDADPSNFNKECLDNEGDDAGASKSYFSAQVCIFFSVSHSAHRLIPISG